MFAGTPVAAAIVLRELVKSGMEIPVVITRPDAPVGRKRVLTQSAVAAEALSLGIPVIKTLSVDAETQSRLIAERVQFGLIVAYGSILKQDALECLPGGWYNLHYSLLPKYRGAAPVQHALLSGDDTTGVTIFKLAPGIDTGDVLATLETQISPDENAGDLLTRLSILGSTLLLQELPRLDGNQALAHQVGQASAAPKLTRDSSKVDFNSSAIQVHNLVRACNPEPGAWCFVGEQTFKIHATRAAADRGLTPGQVETEQGKVLVGCGTGSLELIEVQPSGKNRMSAADWIRGLSRKPVLR
ncbi:MAG: hypothetical protein RLZZ400_300 [Actinomycetota bacterium]